MKKIILSSLVAATLISTITPTISVVATAENDEPTQVTEISESIPEINDIPSVATAFDLYLTSGETSFDLDSKAAEMVTTHDYKIMTDAVAELNSALTDKENGKNSNFTTFAAPSMTVYTKYLSNSQAKTWSYNLSRVGTTTGVIGLLASFGVPAAALVGLAGFSAAGLADTIDYRNNGKGVIMYFRLNGITVRSR